MLIAMGSPLYTDFPHYRIPSPRKILGKLPPPPHKAERIVRSYVKAVEKGKIRTTGDVVEMWEFLTCVLQQAYVPRWLGKEGREEWEIMKLVEKAEEFPPIWVIQGEEDSVVSSLVFSILFLISFLYTSQKLPYLALSYKFHARSKYD
jgi:hypothetical protein